MSNQSDLLQHLNEIKAVPNAAVKHCSMPMHTYIHEAERLHTRISTDLPQLLSAGMPEALPDQLLTYVKALRRAQLNWEERQSERDKALALWKAEASNFYELRKHLLDHMRFAYRNNAVLLKKLAAIKEKSNHAEIVMDLSRLAVLGKQNTEPLQAIQFDLSLLEKSALEAERMAKLRANVNCRLNDNEEAVVIRNKAFTLLKQVVDEIRGYGKFVFRNQPEHLKHYSSHYRREQNAAYKRNTIAKAPRTKD